MDFHATPEQAAILEAVARLLEQHAGPARAIALDAKGEYDFALERTLVEAGFADVGRSDGAGPLEAALVVEAVAGQAGTVALGARALIAPGVFDEPGDEPLALARAGETGPIRYACHARTLLVAEGERVRVVPLEAGDAEPVRSNFGYPLGRLAGVADRGQLAAVGSGERMRCWWRVALAAEAAGTMRAALALTVDYLKQRRQFGRPLGSFQALQHRLAECHVLAEGSRWLAYEAAWRGAPPAAAASAAAYAMAAAARVFAETHQLSGAIGFTREHDLHVFSMRLVALRLELGAVAGQRRAAARARWLAGP
ncbi:MAG: acyl-CoA dehydrogenase family protein [Myxococcota bacterium]